MIDFIVTFRAAVDIDEETVKQALKHALRDQSLLLQVVEVKGVR